jgi:hypothetical protein
MADARSKLDILYQDVLGDIHEIIVKVETLKTELPVATDAMADKLNVQTGNYLAAASKLADVLVNMTEKFDLHVNQATISAAASASESAKLDIIEAATKAATISVQQAVGKEIAVVVSQVSVAGANFSKEVKAARIEIQNSEKHVNWSVAKYVGVIFLAVLAATVITTATQIYLVPKIGSMAGISEDDKKFVQAGRDITFVYNKLTDAERNRISKILAQRQ